MPFKTDRIIAYSPTFENQTTFGTALAQAKLTKAIRAKELKAWRTVATFKDFDDCSAQYMQSQRVTSRYQEGTFQFEGTPVTIYGWLQFVMGHSAAPTGTNPLTHAGTMLGPSERNLPVTTLRIGKNDGTDVGYIVKDVVGGSFLAESKAGRDSEILVTVKLYANCDETAATGTTWPGCYSGTPSLLSEGDFTTLGTSYIASLKQARFEFDNNVLTGDAAFTGSSVDVTRWLRGQKRTYSLAGSIVDYKSPSSALWTLLKAGNGLGTSGATSWAIGAAGNRVTIAVPSGYVRAAETPEEDFGEAEEITLQVAAVGRKTDGDSTTPVSATGVIPSTDQAVAFGLAA